MREREKKREREGGEGGERERERERERRERERERERERQRRVHRGGGRVEGVIVEIELQQLKEALGVPAKAVTELAGSLSRAAILGSFKVWCSRNIQQ